MSAQLLPCPFCNGTAKYIASAPDPNEHWIECTLCSASLEEVIADKDEAQALLAKRWNARVHP